MCLAVGRWERVQKKAPRMSRDIYDDFYVSQHEQTRAVNRPKDLIRVYRILSSKSEKGSNIHYCL